MSWGAKPLFKEIGKHIQAFCHAKIPVLQFMELLGDLRVYFMVLLKTENKTVQTQVFSPPLWESFMLFIGSEKLL